MTIRGMIFYMRGANHCLIHGPSSNALQAANEKSFGFGLGKSAADAYAAKAYSSSGQVAIDMIEGTKGHGFGGFDYR